MYKKVSTDLNFVRQRKKKLKNSGKKMASLKKA